MNKQILKTMNRLCGDLEDLQARLHPQNDNCSDMQRIAYERVSKAKRELIEAIYSYDNP